MVTTTTAAIQGLIGGATGTVVMTAAMMVASGDDDSPPPFAVFWARYVGGGTPEDAMPQALTLHLFYGVVAGAVFGGGVVLVDLSLDLGPAVLWGLAYGVLLLVVGAGFWMRGVLGVEPEPSDVAQFGVLHLIYGAVLGGTVALV